MQQSQIHTIEQAVLGALVNAPQHTDEVLSLLTASDFSNVDHIKIYSTIAELHSQGAAIDPVTVGDRIGNIAYVVDLSQNAPAANNAPAYAGQLAKHCKQRAVRAALTDALTTIDAEGSDAVLEYLQTAIADIGTRNRPGHDCDFATALRRGMLLAEEARASDDRGAIAFGLPGLDERLPVLRGRGLLVVVAARPSVGKTALSNQLTLTTAKRGLPFGKIELEMSIEEMALRSISAEYLINNSALAAGQDDAIEQLTAAVQGRNISDLPIFLDDRSYSPETISARITEWHRKHGIVAVTIDHLQLIAAKGESRNNALGEITRSLKLAAKRLKMPIFLMSQLARLNERENRRPKLSDLRDSGAIEQDADIVLALHSENLDADENGIRWVELGLLKNRGGRTGWIPRSYAFDGRYQTFTEHPLQQTAGAPGGPRAQGARGAGDRGGRGSGPARADGRGARDVWRSPGSPGHWEN
jgi:replicative DNA helicase